MQSITLAQMGGEFFGSREWFEIIFGFSVLIFALLICTLLTVLALRTKGRLQEWAFKLFGLTILVSGGLFLIAAGYSEDQMSPVIGLLGTIAGFVLGKDIQSNDASLPAAPVDVTPAKADI